MGAKQKDRVEGRRMVGKGVPRRGDNMCKQSSTIGDGGVGRDKAKRESGSPARARALS